MEQATDYRPPQQQAVDTLDEAIDSMDALGDRIERLIKQDDES